MSIHNLADNLRTLLQSAASIGITTHVESDGDGMVAAFALQNLLQVQGFESTIITDGEDLSLYSFLEGERQVQSFHEGMAFALMIVLDCNSYDRLGARAALVSQAATVVVIDHHVKEHNPIAAELEYIDAAYASVGALLYDAFEAMINLQPEATQRYLAECIYTTLMNDTNNFVNANTDAKTFELAAKLVAHGAMPHLLYMAFLQNNSAMEMRYIGSTLATIELHHEGQILFLHSDYALKAKLNVNPESFKQATRYVQGVRGLKALVYFREDEPGVWKLSLRSLKLNVQQIASQYGGGGHRQASGCRLNGKLAELKEQILRDITQAIAAQ